jgi:murein DD-endopeptidase MepM/ murein hydrolase activator NlpD
MVSSRRSSIVSSSLVRRVGTPARRRVASGLAVAACAGAIGLGSFASAQSTVVRLDAPGSALAPAERLSLRPQPAPSGRLSFPVDPGSDCYVLDNFGDGRGTRRHEGIDIMGSAGRPVFAVAPGMLTKRYTDTGTAGWGWTLHDPTTDTFYKYFHLAEDPNGLGEGDTVAVGDVLGYVGSSGTSSPDNFHLHFEVRPEDVAVDPLPLLHVDRDRCRISPPIR